MNSYDTWVAETLATHATQTEALRVALSTLEFARVQTAVEAADAPRFTLAARLAAPRPALLIGLLLVAFAAAPRV